MNPPAHTRTTFEPQIAVGIPYNLVLFDGVCVLCSGWVAFIVKRDTAGEFKFASIQGVQGSEIARQLGIDPEDPATNAVVLNGTAFFKSDSALAVLGKLSGWRWARTLTFIPRSLRDWIYDRVARNRYAVFGRTTACMLPEPHQRSRFLDLNKE